MSRRLLIISIVLLCHLPVFLWLYWNDEEVNSPNLPFSDQHDLYDRPDLEKFFSHIQKNTKLKERMVNETLDFEKVFVINLPHRHDRKDQMTVLTAISGIKVEFIDGITIKNDSRQMDGLPKQQEQMSLGKLGCFRAHANVWRKIVAEDITSALILEDDIDWDFRVKEIITRLSQPLRNLAASLQKQKIQEHQEKKRDKGSSAWIGNSNKYDWDIIRLGTCIEYAHTYDIKANSINESHVPYTFYRDSSVVDSAWISFDHREVLQTYNIPIALNSSFPSQSRFRLIQKSNYPVCLHAYAVTRSGAAKLLIQTGRGLIDGANDLTIALRTQEEKFRSFTVVPPIFSQWKRAGWSGNSDIDRLDASGIGTDNSSHQNGNSWNIRESVRSVLHNDDYVELLNL